VTATASGPIDLLLVHAAELATLARGSVPRCGADLAECGVIGDGAVAVAGGRIVAVGTTDAVRRALPPGPPGAVIDAGGRLVTPGLVDPHTHLVFAGNRAREFSMRLRGAGYEEILAGGGGILSTVRATREAPETELVASGRQRLDRMLAHGTTTVEAKSGYGLSLADELKILRATSQLAATHAVSIVPTFLGAHVVPLERRADPDGYVRDVCEVMLPAVAEAGLAEYCDVFCERGVFSVEQSRRILRAADRLGLGLKIHADQLSASGGARLAAEVGAVSADHLEHTPADDLEAMADRGVTAGLLPGATFFLLSDRYAGARAMVDRGVPIALATDFNPGSSPTLSMQMAIALACVGMRLTPEEALSAATVNAAHAIGRAEVVGTLTAGKSADLVIWGVSSVAELPLHFGTNMVDTVVKAGRVVAGGKGV
jgi:imidazolonepropionase